MTPFGDKVRILRNNHSIKQSQLARIIGVSPAYLSSLENGKRGLPSVEIVEGICTFFNIIWDDADDIRRSAELSHPKIIIDTSDIDNPNATLLSNLLAEKISKIDDEKINELLEVLERK